MRALGKLVLGLAAALALMLGAAPAHARWLKATGETVIVYSEGSEKGLRQYVVKLDAFDAMLRAITGSKDKNKNKGEKLSVYLVDSSGAREISPSISSSTGGFYSANEGHVAAIAVRAPNEMFPTSMIFFHEYAHHFTQRHFPSAYPQWFFEGFAEYVSTAEVSGEYPKIGGIPVGRAYTLVADSWMPWKQVVGFDEIEKPNQNQTYRFYAQSWLLVSYMYADKDRANALLGYLKGYAEGKTGWAWFEKSMGVDEATLKKNLTKYAKHGVPISLVKSQIGDPAAISIETLPESADDLLLLALRASSEIEEADKAEFLARVRKLADKYPGDRFARHTLVQAEISAGDPRRALDLLGAPPADDAEANYLAGLAWQTIAFNEPAGAAESRKKARVALARSFQLDGNRYQTLYRYVLAQLDEPGQPDVNTLNVALRARDLAPQVVALNELAAICLMENERFEEAINLLRILNAQPHIDDAYRDHIRTLLKAAEERQKPPEGPSPQVPDAAG